MKKLLIQQCNDPMLWYADKVGQYVDFLGFGDQIDGERDVYWSRDSGGHKNIVYVTDAIIFDFLEAA